MRVAIVGASGFVGTAVVHYLTGKGLDVVPLVGSTGNSWHLLSQGFEPRVGNVLNTDWLETQLIGCTHVVNCLRGSERVMLDGIKNLLKAANTRRVERFIHLSSVAIYGDPPPPEAKNENSSTKPLAGSYGWIKLEQDRLVRRASTRGLSSIILCPPNIIGPASEYLLQILGTLLGKRFALVGDGGSVCNTVDVMNLAHACFIALNSKAVGTHFITDDEFISWKRMVNAVRVAGQVSLEPGSVSAAWLRGLSAPVRGRRTNLIGTVKHLVSSDVRRALRSDPLLTKVDSMLRNLIARLGTPVEDKLRLSIEGPPRIPKDASGRTLDVRLCAQQLRGVWHSCEKAKSELGYRPLYSFDQSMQAFGTWLTAARGVSGWDWPLRKELFGYQE
jgi:nucleoside-diphosphate-sugar epimerase